MSSAPAPVWFRQDLRLADNPALEFVRGRGAPIVPVFVWAPEEEEEWAPGAASRWWLHHSLAALEQSLAKQHLHLVIRTGRVLDALRDLARQSGARAVVWNRRYEPGVIRRDTALKRALLDDGLEVRSFNGALLHSPTAVKNKSDKPFQVFTPFWKHCRTLPVRDEIALADKPIIAPGTWPGGEKIDSLGLLPSIGWDREFYEHWKPGEAGARLALKQFLAGATEDYAQPGVSTPVCGAPRDCRRICTSVKSVRCRSTMP